MYNYRNEASFSNALCKAMRAKGWFVQRIESGTTGKGIPDIYTISPQHAAMWIELKRVHHNCGAEEIIPWRPGQQSWLFEVSRRGQSAQTVVAFNDCMLVIPHYCIYKGDKIITNMRGISRCHNFKELLR